MFGIKVTTVRKWIKHNEINGTKIGKQWFFRQEDIDQLFVDNLTFDGSTISSDQVNGTITITPTGTGTLRVQSTTALVVPVGTVLYVPSFARYCKPSPLVTILDTFVLSA